jgi:hypothetical protein
LKGEAIITLTFLQNPIRIASEFTAPISLPCNTFSRGRHFFLGATPISETWDYYLTTAIGTATSDFSENATISFTVYGWNINVWGP